jgi:hypothetical protein
LASIGDSNTFTYSYGNTLIFGAQNPGGVNTGANLLPEEAWNVDSKIDDGKPSSGKIFMRSLRGFGHFYACTTATSTTDYTGNYKLTNNTAACALYFANAF